jgi:hypothetical protein
MVLLLLSLLLIYSLNYRSVLIQTLVTNYFYAVVYNPQHPWILWKGDGRAFIMTKKFVTGNVSENFNYNLKDGCL